MRLFGLFEGKREQPAATDDTLRQQLRDQDFYMRHMVCPTAGEEALTRSKKPRGTESPAIELAEAHG